MRSVLAAVAVVAMGFMSDVRAEECLRYKKDVVTLQGVVRPVTVYMQVDAGKDRTREKRKDFPVLYLDTPVCLEQGQSDEFARSNINSIQLFSPPGKYFNTKLQGVHLAITGTLWTRKGDGITDIVLIYKQVSSAP